MPKAFNCIKVCKASSKKKTKKKTSLFSSHWDKVAFTLSQSVICLHRVLHPSGGSNDTIAMQSTAWEQTSRDRSSNQKIAAFSRLEIVCNIFRNKIDWILIHIFIISLKLLNNNRFMCMLWGDRWLENKPDGTLVRFLLDVFKREICCISLSVAQGVEHAHIYSTRTTFCMTILLTVFLTFLVCILNIMLHGCFNNSVNKRFNWDHWS